MLHELLLSLALGHTSSLFSSRKEPSLSSLLSPSEAALIRTLIHLGNLQSEIRAVATAISASHPSAVARAVANAVQCVHLAAFQEKVLDVERGILNEDATFVGAYDIIPLSGIVVAFDGWERKLDWLQALVVFTASDCNNDKQTKPSVSPGKATGARLIDWLRMERQTGFPDLEQIALSLTRVAESTWLRQVSGWVLYGRLPTSGSDDFYIQKSGISNVDSALDDYELRQDLLPSFVSNEIANSMLSVGKLLNHVQALGIENQNSQKCSLDSKNDVSTSGSIGLLSSLESPITSSSLAGTIQTIRSLVSKNTLQRLLPFTDTLHVLNVLRSFFLLECGEFAIALVAAADMVLVERQQRLTVNTKQPKARLGGTMVKEGEVAAILKYALMALVAHQDIEDDDADDEVETARRLFRLSVKGPQPPSSKVRLSSTIQSSGHHMELSPIFGDALLATPVALSMVVPSPLDLFLASDDVYTYSRIHAYLLAIRRAHVHLTELWKLNVLRRTHPSHHGRVDALDQDTIAAARIRANVRTRKMRSVWAVVSSVIIFLAEFEDYLHGEVIKGSWQALRHWMDPSESSKLRKHSADNHPTMFKSDVSDPLPHALPSKQSDKKRIPYDPETLTNAHRLYLQSLTHLLLIRDISFTKALRALMIKLDRISLLMRRLSVVQQSLELQESTDPNNISRTQASEEKDLAANLSDICGVVKQALKGLIKRLRAIDLERLGGETVPHDNSMFLESDFVPWQGNGVVRLLMKLDFGDDPGMGG